MRLNLDGRPPGPAIFMRPSLMDRTRVFAEHLLFANRQTMFTSGPRLTDGVDGDPRRQAVASLRGYAYQLYATALAWIGLAGGDELHLEVAEDYAVLSQGGIEAVQVRDTAASGGLTLRSAGVAQTITSFVDLARRNPSQSLTLRYLTTAAVSTERAVEDRPAGAAGLDYWRRAAAGADVAPLRDMLAKMDLGPEAARFIAERDDDALRADLLRRIHWDCGAVDIGGMRREFEAAVLELGLAVGGFTVAEAQTLVAEILDAVLARIVSGEDRVLTPDALQGLLQRASHVSVPRRQPEALTQDAVAGFVREAPWRAEDDTPLPALLAPRRGATADLANRVRRESLAFACGATGMGKTLLARLAARSLGGDWRVADFAGLDAAQSAERLGALLGALAVTPFDGIILDDLNTTDAPEVAVRLARLRAALARRDRLCLVTAYRAPPARLRSELAVSPDASRDVDDLAETEVHDLIAAAGGQAARWTRAIYVATACGHPQLVQATIADLQWRGWPAADYKRLYALDWSGLDIAAQRAAARRRLVETAPEAARALLARLSLLIGSFRREVAVELAQLDPAISAAGDHLDALTGPWIDQVGPDRLRLSPLLSDAGTTALSRAAQTAVHRAAADLLLGGKRLNVEDANAGAAHALAARSPGPLRRLAASIIRANAETRSRLAGWITTLQLLRADAPIFPEDLELSRLLRLAQVLLVAASDDALGLAEKWRALRDEIAREPDVKARERLELTVLARVLLEQRIAETPDWVAQLARLDELLQRYADQMPVLVQAADPLGHLFSNLTMGIVSVDGLAAAFAQLDALSPDVRERILGRLHAQPEEIGYIVNHPWVAERDGGEVDGRPRAETYLGLARQAAGWGEPELAVRCHVARSIMLDEFADDEAGALAALQLGEDELGHHLALSRARAKVAYRRRRFGDALALAREVMQGGLRQDPVERMFLCREAAISAAEVGQETEALDWFRRALAAAEETKSESLQVTIVGLRADVALAEWRCGDHDRALRDLWTSLDAAQEIDPESSLKATYLHKVLGHAGLWLFGEASQRRLPVGGGPCIAPPGLCSNPEPPEDIRTLPRASIEGTRYMLASVDIHRGGALGLDEALTEILGDRHVFTLECQRRLARLECAVATLDLARLPRAIGEAMEAMSLGVEVMQARREPADVMPVVGGPFPRAPEAARRGERAASFVNNAFLALEVLADLRGDAAASGAIAQVAEDLARAGYATPTYVEDPASWQGAFHAIWRRSRETSPLLAEDLFTTGLRMIEWASRSGFARAVLPDLGRWAARAWPIVLATQQFRLRNPGLNVPAIEAAIAAEMSDVDRLAAILAAARPAFAFNLDAGMLALLKPLREVEDAV